MMEEGEMHSLALCQVQCTTHSRLVAADQLKGSLNFRDGFLYPRVNSLFIKTYNPILSFLV